MENRKRNLEVRDLPLEQVTLVEGQPRVDFPEAERKELAASLLTNGQKVPATVYPQGDKYVVVDGARRKMAAADAGLKTLTAIVLDHKPEPAELQLHQLLANSHRLELNPLELCEAYKKLMQLRGLNAAELAKTVSKSKTYVSNVLSLDSLPPALQQLIRERRVGLAKAALIARMAPAEQGQLATAALSRDELERKTARKKPEGKPVSRVTLEMPVATVCLAGKVKLRVEDLIDLLQALIRECKRARSQGIDLSTLACILRDRAQLPREGGG